MAKTRSKNSLNMTFEVVSSPSKIRSENSRNMTSGAVSSPSTVRLENSSNMTSEAVSLDMANDSWDIVEPLTLNIFNWAKNSNWLWVVPEEHRLAIKRQYYDSIVASYWGRDITYELLSCNLWSEGYRNEVTTYVTGCIPYQKAKANWHAWQSTITLIPTGSLLWQKIAMDFMSKLPESVGFNAILIITNRFME